MPRIDDSTDAPLLFTSNTQWLEEIDARRCLSPEGLLATLEEMLDTGELTYQDAITYITDLKGISR